MHICTLGEGTVLRLQVQGILLALGTSTRYRQNKYRIEVMIAGDSIQYCGFHHNSHSWASRILGNWLCSGNI